MDKIDRIREIRNKMRKAKALNPERLDEIEIDVKGVREERLKKSKNQRTKEKYAFKKAQLIAEIGEENPLELPPPAHTEEDFSDFSEILKAKAMVFKNKRKGILDDKREYKATKEIKRLEKIKRKNDHIMKEGVRFIKHLIPLVNVHLDMNKVNEEYESILKKFQEMQEVNRTPIAQFKKGYTKWLEERAKMDIQVPLSEKAAKYKLLYNFEYQIENEEDDDDISESEE